MLFRSQAGEKVEKTSYFNIVAWGYTAENSANILEKGLGVIVVGTLDQRSYEDKEGNKRNIVEVKAMDIGVRAGALESIERRKSNRDSGEQTKSAPRRTKETVPADEPF